MGSRKHNRAEKIKAEKKSKYFARLNNCPVSPRKMRLVADLVRGKDVNTALDTLHYNPKHASKYLEKLIKSAIANWKVKNDQSRLEDADLFIQEIYVDSAGMLKRIQPAPQGRAHRIRKRSNHVTVFLGDMAEFDEELDFEEETEEVIEE